MTMPFQWFNSDNVVLLTERLSERLSYFWPSKGTESETIPTVSRAKVGHKRIFVFFSLCLVLVQALCTVFIQS